jgi:hypothetical protein
MQVFKFVTNGNINYQVMKQSDHTYFKMIDPLNFTFNPQKAQTVFFKSEQQKVDHEYEKNLVNWNVEIKDCSMDIS